MRRHWWLAIGCSLCLGLAVTAQERRSGQEAAGAKSPQAETAPKAKKGNFKGTVDSKGSDWIKVTPEAAPEPLRLVPRWIGGSDKEGGGYDKEMLAKIARTAVGARVEVEWVWQERYRVVGLSTLERERRGTWFGKVDSKGSDWIKVKDEDGPELRRFTPMWVGGLPKDGGGYDKEMLARIAKTPVGAKVQVEWLFQESYRALSLKTTDAPPPSAPPKPPKKEETRVIVSNGPLTAQDSRIIAASVPQGAGSRVAANSVPSGSPQVIDRSSGGREGTLEGKLTAKGADWLEIQPAQGGAERLSLRGATGNPAPELLAKLSGLRVGATVKAKWVLEERKRVTGIE